MSGSHQISMSSGDKISGLPMNNDIEPKQSDLEIIHNIFNSPKTKETVTQTVSSFKLSFVAGLLFALFTLPFITKLVENYCKGNPIFTKLVLIILFMLSFYIIQKLVLKA